LNRRFLLRLLAAGIASTVTAIWAEQSGKVPVVGLLMLSAGPNDPIVERIRRELRSLGYVDGTTIHIEYRGAEGQSERLPQLAQELVALKVDAIIVGAVSIARAAKQATNTVPIVMVAFDYDPVEAGLVASLSRPGGNVTGIFPRTSDLVGKNLGLLKELLPRASHVAVLYDSMSTRQLKALEAAARALNVQLQMVEVRPPYDYSAALRDVTRRKPDALMVLNSAHSYVARDQIANLALQYKLPTICQLEPNVRAGGLISYGPDQLETFGRTAYFVDRVLKGASPAQLPIEQPTEYLLVVNLKTAKALGITIPESILLRADEVIK
jgi:putative tryptophan/tyrosine transport system substrate-binding protein